MGGGGGDGCITFGGTKLIYAHVLALAQVCMLRGSWSNTNTNPDEEDSDFFCWNDFYLSDGLPVVDYQCTAKLNGMSCTSCSVCGQLLDMTGIFSFC